MRRNTQFKTAARKKGLKLTPQRLEIFSEVAFSVEQPDAETVYPPASRRWVACFRRTSRSGALAKMYQKEGFGEYRIRLEAERPERVSHVRHEES